MIVISVLFIEFGAGISCQGGARIVESVREKENITLVGNLSEEHARPVNELSVLIIQLAPGVVDLHVFRKLVDAFKVEDKVEQFQQLFVIEMNVAVQRL